MSSIDVGLKYIRDILFGVIIIKVKVNIKQVMLGTAALAGMLVTSQAVANADSMTIKAGDTVWAYSQKYHVSVNKIAEANGLSNPDLIIAGKTINIPGVKTATVNTLSVYDILNYDKFIVSSEAVKKIEEVYA